MNSATLVLVHGACHGGWCWQRVVPGLRAAGYEVYAPTLTGLGERAHILTRETELETHIRDVVGLMEYEDVVDAVLVGHSYGGLVISAVADRVPERVTALVFVDAPMPTDGNTNLDLLGPILAESVMQRSRLHGDGWLVPPLKAEQYGVLDPSDQRWVESRLTPHPLRSFMQPVSLCNPEALRLRRTYIACTRAGSPWPGCVYRRLDTGHDAMVTDPVGLTSLLFEATRGD